MTRLLPALVSLAAVDALNPATTTVAIYLGASTRRLAPLVAFIAGVWATYFLGGVVLLLGPAHLGDSLVNGQHSAITQTLEIGIGLGLIGIGVLFWHHRHGGRPRARSLPRLALWGAAAMGGVVTVVDLPTAVPYFTAIALLTNAHVSDTAGISSLAIYNSVYIVPALLVLGTYWLLGSRSERVLLSFGTRLERATPVVLAAFCVAAGATMLVRGIALS